MRLWSLHPALLDAKGLVAAWREALLAQAVLSGLTKGYRHHPQLIRFTSCPDSLATIAAYLHGIHKEATLRGYKFDEKKIRANSTPRKLPVTRGQLLYELDHLSKKLKIRDRQAYEALRKRKHIRAHPLFRIVPGGVEEWEAQRKRFHAPWKPEPKRGK